MKQVVGLIVSSLLAAATLYVLHNPILVLPWGELLDPAGGLYYTARSAVHPVHTQLDLSGLSGPVEIVRDERGVPHIFAQDDLDGVTALGYVVAQDRLFQMDFIPRVASGRLAEVLGAGAIETDRFLRSTGMEWGARKNLARIIHEDGEELAIIEAYVRGVNAYIESLSDNDAPFEFRLLGYKPELYTPLHVVRILQYMTYDLTYRTDDASYAELISRLGPEGFGRLYPQFARLFVPIIPEPGGQMPESSNRAVYTASVAIDTAAFGPMRHQEAMQEALAGTWAEGFRRGKGSNNWAVNGDRSATGAPILAGDMHLGLSLPSIWYEAHMVTPSFNSYGVLIPGAPVLTEAYNDYLGWAYTNTGSDQIDHYSIELNEARDAYRYEDTYRPLTLVRDTIYVKDASPVVDTLRYAHWGPILEGDDGDVALQWVAHKPSRTLLAQWKMNKAKSFKEFQEALTFWDTPMQNVLYGDMHGNIAIRSTGYLPIRRGGPAYGLLDGTSSDHEWTGRVPFEELPFSFNPDQGYLTSTNQQPADSTYPYYQGHDWGPGVRSLRINALLSGKDRHTVDDLKVYQSDVYVVLRDLFAPLLEDLDGLSERAEELKTMLERWPGEASVERPEPLVLFHYLQILRRAAWDEAEFSGVRDPSEEQLYWLLAEDPQSAWLDIQSTEAVEDANALMRHALEATADTLENRYGWDRAQWRWGNHHKVLFRHVTRNDALKPLFRGPMEYPGFRATLSPASQFVTTHSASWRVVVDFSTQPPTGYGVYPGGQSGNPFSPHYDEQIQPYIDFLHYELAKPRVPEEVEQVSSRLFMNLPSP